MSIIIYYIIFRVFLNIFMSLIHFGPTDILCQISSDISVKSKYRYIRDYRYFHP